MNKQLIEQWTFLLLSGEIKQIKGQFLDPRRPGTACALGVLNYLEQLTGMGPYWATELEVTPEFLQEVQDRNENGHSFEEIAEFIGETFGLI